MKEAIKNFINLLIKGDFFLIFLLVMIVVIILVILYLIRLEIKNNGENDEYEEEDKKYENIEMYVKKEETPVKEEIEKEKENISIKEEDNIMDEITMLLENPLEDMFEEKEEVIPTKEIEEPIKEEIEEPVKEETIEVITKEEPAPVKQPVKQMNMFEYENEQEEKAIISAEELAKRLNDMKSSSESFTEEEIEKYENEQEEKAIISYDELLKRATEGIVNYEEKEDLGGITVSKVDFDKGKEVTFDYKEEETQITNAYQKEEAFLASLKAFRRSL